MTHANREAIGRNSHAAAYMSDIFDSSLNLEEQFIEEGRQEGIRYITVHLEFTQLCVSFTKRKASYSVVCRQGRVQGYRDGVSLGVDKGFEIGSELGFYTGALKVNPPAHSLSRFESPLS